MRRRAFIADAGLRWRAVAMLLALASPLALPSAADALEPSVDGISAEASQSVASLLMKEPLAATPVIGRLDLSFTVLESGLIPSVPACGQSLHAQFIEQMRRLGAAMRTVVNPEASLDQAMVSVVVGDTRQLMEPVARPNPFETQWKKAAARLGDIATIRGVNLGLHHDFSVNWTEGFYDRASERLLYGRIWIHWWGVNLDMIDGVEQCQVNFVEHVLWLFVANLDRRFLDQFYEMKREWIRRAGFDPDRDHAAAHQVERLLQAGLMCAQFQPVAGSASFARCSRQVAELVTDIPH